MTAARAILAGPLLWAAHFLAVYIFVSLACLWRWHHRTLGGLPLVEVVVAGITVVFVVALVLYTLAALRLQGFQRQLGVMMGLFFIAAITMVGIPTLIMPVCR